MMRMIPRVMTVKMMQMDEELGDGDVIGGADSMDEDFDAYTQDYSDDMNSDVQYGADDTEAAG